MISYNWCTKCQIFKYASHFQSNKTTATGYQKWCRGCVNAKKKKKRDEHRAENPKLLRARAQVEGIKVRSKKFNLPFDAEVVTAAYLVELLDKQTHCECCGHEFSHEFLSKHQRNPASPSVDRVNPEDGYTLSNIAILCWRCNQVKNDGTAHEHQRIADWMNARQARG